MKIREIEIPDTRPFIVKASEYKPSKDFNPPKTLGKPRGKTGEAKRVMAMDACIKNVLSGFKDELYSCGTPMFAGYGLLSSISQEALIRAGVDTIADEMTRKFVKFRYDVDDGREDHEKELSELEQELEKYKIKDRFNEAAQKDGYFGGCLGYIDVGELDEEEAQEPLILDKKTFKKGMFKGLKIIEPVNIYPGEYNTTDPTDEHYFNPEYWYVLGKRYHASRFVYFASNEVPLLLKPAYNFFGIARAQLALDYIAHFVENRESAQELLNKFSLTCWKTDMSQVLAGESCNDLVKRVRMFNKMKSNNGTLVVDKEQEDIMQLNTPLSGVRDIVEMSLNLLTAVWRIPKIKYIGEGEGGLNASSKEQMRSFYDFILSQKEKMFTQPMETVLKILQLNMGKEVNPAIGFEFPSLVEMDDSEIASLNKMKADTAVSLINAGVVSQEEVRQNLSMDKHSGFSMIDVDDVPEQPEEPEKEIVDVEDADLAFDEFNESDHPRDDEGKFTESGKSKSKNAIVMTEKQWEEYSNKWDKDGKDGYPIPIGKTLSIVKKNKYGGKDLNTDGEFYGKNLRSALSKFIKNSPKEVAQWKSLLYDLSDKELEDFLLDEKVDADANYIKGEYIREEDGKSLYYFWTKNSIDGTVEDADLTMDDRWITIKKDHDNPDEKGRHLLLEGEGENQETPAEAMKRQWKVDLNKKDNQKDESSKEDKKDEKQKKTDIPENDKSDKEEKSIKKYDKAKYGELDAKLRNLMDERINIENGKDNFIRNNEELKDLSEKIQIAKNRYFRLDGKTAENEKALNEAENDYNKKYNELEKEYADKNNLDGIKQEISRLQNEKHEAFLNMRDYYSKGLGDLSDEELKSKRINLSVDKREIQRKYDERLSNNSEYRESMMRKSDLMDARWSILKKDYLDDDDKKRLEKVNEELKKAERKCEKFIIDTENKKTTDTIELDAEIQAIEEEQTKRYDAKEKQKKEAFEKEKKERAEKGKVIAKDNYYPKTIAGVQRGKEMSEEEADSGNPNPNYGIGRGYGINCQSCVVCYEARLRGYNVMTLPNTRDSKLSELSHDTNMAWIDPKTGLKPEPLYTKAKNSRQCYKFLEENVKSGERYNFSFGWKRSRQGHIVSISRNKENKVEIYDPQTNSRVSGDKLLEYLTRLSYGDRVKVRTLGNISGGIDLVSKTELLRVDNLAFNPEFMNDIMEAKK